MQYRNTSIVQSVTQLQPCEHCCALLQIKIVFIYIMRLAAIGEKLRLINFVSTEIVHFILKQWHKLHKIFRNIYFCSCLFKELNCSYVLFNTSK